MKTPIELIAAERDRQITAEGYSAAHDDAHEDGSLAVAAGVYCDTVPCILNGVSPEVIREQILTLGCDGSWPWEPEYLKVTDDPIRMLVKAGALIYAEIERLQRALENFNPQAEA